MGFAEFRGAREARFDSRIAGDMFCPMNSGKRALVCGALVTAFALGHAACATDEDAPEADLVAKPSPRPPNILLITIDTQRSDSFGIYGNDGGHTPHIDRLASKATVFERATSPIGTTFPSHASLLTGLYPRRHGLRYNGDALDDDFVTLAELLSAAGYETMAFVSYGSMVSRGGLGQGFVRTSHEKNGARAFSTNPARITSMARGLLGRKRPFPFFMWVQYFHPHAPYELTEYAKEELEGIDGFAEALADGATVGEFYSFKSTNLGAADRKALRALYDGETREADRTIGLILESLETAGLADNTIVVITADHGQLLGEHEDVGHGFRLWEPVLDIPLVIYDPRSPEPRRVESRVGLVDVAPTLLEMVGLEAPGGIDGRSLVPALRGENLEDRPYYGEVCGVRKKKDKKSRDENALAVFVGDKKLIVEHGSARFYDLETDPSEMAPVLDISKDSRAEELAALAEGYREKAAETKGQTAPDALSPKVRAELEALGYIQPGE